MATSRCAGRVPHNCWQYKGKFGPEGFTFGNDLTFSNRIRRFEMSGSYDGPSFTLKARPWIAIFLTSSARRTRNTTIEDANFHRPRRQLSSLSSLRSISKSAPRANGRAPKLRFVTHGDG